MPVLVEPNDHTWWEEEVEVPSVVPPPDLLLPCRRHGVACVRELGFGDLGAPGGAVSPLSIY